MRIIKQHDERDCGATCLSMIANYYGLHYPISKYRELTKTDQNGVTLYGLCDAAQKIGFKSEALCGEINELINGIQKGEVKLPFIAFVINEDNMQHFVVVFEVIIDDFYTSDESIVCEDNCNEEHEHIEEKLAEQESVFNDVLMFVTDNASNFNLFFICLIGLYILQAAICFWRGYLILLISKKIDLRLMLPYYDHIVDLPIKSVNTRNTGEYLSRFSDASAVRDAVSGATLTLILDSVMVFGCGVILYLENEKLFYISLIVIFLYAIIVLCYKKPLNNANRAVMENNARAQSYLKESIDGVETIKSFCAEDIAKRKSSIKFRQLINTVFENGIISISQDCICGLVEYVGVVIVLWVGFVMVINREITIGSLITFYALLAYFTEPIKNLISLQPMMQTSIVAAERLNDILDIEREQQLTDSKKELEFKIIKFSSVDFRYGNHKLALKNVSLDVKKGDRIAIVGESGSGKTTLAKLLMKFYSPESGTIEVDNINISDLSASDIRKCISYVPQTTFLFSDTIKNNLLISNPNATDKEIDLACQLSKVTDFMETMPFGYDTFLDENGKNLSGGQRQRLAIAQALLKKPQLLILDEATSNLDSITEMAVEDTIFNLSKDLTCIIIAHRLSTIKNCNKIIVMSGGKIVEVGTHKELLDKRGQYFNLYNRQ